MAQAKPRTRSKPKDEAATPVAPPSVAATQRRWTYADYCAIPDDRLRYEVIRGELLVAPAPKMLHQLILHELAVILGVFIKRLSLGRVASSPVDVRLLPDSTVQPDLIFIRTDKLEIIKENFVEGAPDLVVEVLSDSTAARDRSDKRDLYAENSVPFYWIIAPRTRSLEEYQLTAGVYKLVQRKEYGEIFEPAIFPGLNFALSDLWP